VRPLGGRWRRWALAGVACSLPLLALGWMRPLAVPGLALDLGIAAAALLLPSGVADAEQVGRGARMRVRDVLTLGAVAALAALLLLRPWHVRWGAAESELRAALPGDESVPHPAYQIQHAVTIDAPPEAVWPWLVQLGQDRGGFYSYARLENLFGLRIRNADRVHPEWQRLAEGDSIHATYAGWLGLGRRLGWRVGRVEPNRVLVLERWGAFVLLPEGDSATRLVVRTRGAGEDDLASLVLAPLGLVLFEPAHFLMERKMLLTLRDRAEQPS
jgi:hypothetical protein